MGKLLKKKQRVIRLQFLRLCSGGACGRRGARHQRDAGCLGKVGNEIRARAERLEFARGYLMQQTVQTQHAPTRIYTRVHAIIAAGGDAVFAAAMKRTSQTDNARQNSFALWAYPIHDEITHRKAVHTRCGSLSLRLLPSLACVTHARSSTAVPRRVDHGSTCHSPPLSFYPFLGPSFSKLYILSLTKRLFQSLSSSPGLSPFLLRIYPRVC